MDLFKNVLTHLAIHYHHNMSAQHRQTIKPLHTSYNV